MTFASAGITSGYMSAETFRCGPWANLPPNLKEVCTELALRDKLNAKLRDQILGAALLGSLDAESAALANDEPADTHTATIEQIVNSRPEIVVNLGLERSYEIIDLFNH